MIYQFQQDHESLHIKYSIPAIYSVWEGFIKTTFTIYTGHLSRLNIQRSDISINLLTHHIDTICQLQNPRQNFKSKRNFVSRLVENLFVDTINLAPEIPTESNVTFKVTCSILERFCIDKVDDKYEKELNRLLSFRNKIAHGENTLIVEVKDVDTFVNLIEDLMMDIVIKIQECEKRQTYRKEII